MLNTTSTGRLASYIGALTRQVEATKGAEAAVQGSDTVNSGVIVTNSLSSLSQRLLKRIKAKKANDASFGATIRENKKNTRTLPTLTALSEAELNAFAPTWAIGDRLSDRERLHLAINEWLATNQNEKKQIK